MCGRVVGVTLSAMAISRTRRVAFAPAAVAACCLVAGPALAAPRAVSPAGMVVRQIDLAASGARSVVVMSGFRGSGPHARRQTLAKLSDRPLQRLGGQALGARAAVGRDGTAVAAWVAGHSLRAAIARPGHGFGSPRTLAHAPRAIPRGSAGIVVGDVTVGRDGAGVIGWRQGEGGDSQARVTFTRRSGFGASQILGDSYDPPVIARAPDGTVAAAWVTRPRMPAPGEVPTPEGNPRLVLSTATAGQAFGPPTELAVPPAFFSGQANAFTGPGGAAVRWAEQGTRRIAILRAGGVVQTSELPGARSNDREYDEPISLALPADGSVLAVWRYVRIETTANGQRPLGSQVLASSRPPGGAFSAPRPLSRLDRFAETPAIATLPGGTLTAWRERGPTDRSRLRVRRYAGSAWKAPETVITAPGIGAVRLADAGRSAALAWTSHARAYLDHVRP